MTGLVETSITPVLYAIGPLFEFLSSLREAQRRGNLPTLALQGHCRMSQSIGVIGQESARLSISNQYQRYSFAKRLPV